MMVNAEGINTIFVDTTGTLISAPVRVHHVLLTVDNGSTATLTLRDNGATGVVQLKIRNDNDLTQSYIFNPPLIFATNLHATIAGTGAEAIIVFERQSA